MANVTPESNKAAKKTQNKKIDEEIEESFPASDPPAFAGGKHIVGAPRNRESPSKEPDAGKGSAKKGQKRPK